MKKLVKNSIIRVKQHISFYDIGYKSKLIKLKNEESIWWD